jgi:hypothetical protein
MNLRCVFLSSNCVVEKTVRRAPCGHGTSPGRRCEVSPEPSDVGSVPRTDRLGNGPYTACFRNHQLEHPERRSAWF